MTDAHSAPATTIRIGRQPDNDIALTGNLEVSRHHAELRRNPDGSFEIIDLDSHGGTCVNGKRITRQLLTEQDIISIGQARFRLSGGELRQDADESPRSLPAASAHEVVAAYWAAAEARDWHAFGALLADDVIYRGPQTREQVRGRDPYIRFNVEGFPYDWHLTVQRIVGEGRRAASWIELTGPESTQPGLCFFELADDGKIAVITDFWPEPYELPASRAHLVERY
jgi:FHA domain/SnoaL-like domain